MVDVRFEKWLDKQSKELARSVRCLMTATTTSMSTDKIISNFPLLRFSSLLGVHSILLIFVALFLPRSSFLLSDLPPQASSRDRPQHEFLRPITAEPQLTLVWLCIGAIIVQASWASRLKYETVSVKLQLFGEDEEARVKRTMESSKERLNVCLQKEILGSS